ncbi:hypothetical protein NIA69_21250 [Gemmiger formicilis]|nr:hypothetical protein [Gemmiger formicilis]
MRSPAILWRRSPCPTPCECWTARRFTTAAGCAGSRWGPGSRGLAAIYLRTAANCRPSACGLPPMPRRA